MLDKDEAAEFRRRAAKVREIAQGIFDETERRLVLKFVSDSEKLVAPSGRKLQSH